MYGFVLARLAFVKLQKQRAITAGQQEAKRTARQLSAVEKRWKKELTKSVERAETRAARLAPKERQAEVNALATARQKDRIRHESELIRMQRTVDSLSRKLEKTGE